jgi:uncharacterized protein YjdB
MKNKILLISLFIVAAVNHLFANPSDTITLNLSQSLNPATFTFDPQKGYWTETYNDEDYTFIDFDHFSFSHLIAGPGASFGGYYWDGFTVCNNGDNTDYGSPGNSGSWVSEQWGCMAGGGIKTDANGRVLKDENGKVLVERGIPYLLAYWGYFMESSGTHCLQTILTDAEAPYEAVGMYVNAHPWPYYGNIHGDGFARPFQEGDYFKLFIHGLDENYEDNGKVVEYVLAEFKNGLLTQSPDWEWIDLSALGEVYGFYYTMESTDESPYYGPNTAVYFCMDKLTVCKPATDIPVSSVSLNKTTAELIVGETLQLTATVSPDDATNKNVNWSSSNESIATISVDGLITAVSTGSATITVTTEDGNFTATCAVTVTEPVILVAGVSLNKTAAELIVGKTLQLTATISPDDATNKNVIWESNNESVATVSSEGLITAVSEGSATITVKTEDGNFTATCMIIVTVPAIPVMGISLNQTEAELDVREVLFLVATVLPSDATNKNLIWGSSNTSVAKVYAGGMVLALSTGSATITVTTEDGGLAATCLITVRNVTGINEIGTNCVVYPNPFADYIIIDATENGTATIYDLSGKVLLNTTLKAGKNTVNTSSLTKGIYVLRSGSNMTKIIK